MTAPAATVDTDVDRLLDQAEPHARNLLGALGLLDDTDTPRRMAKALHELTAGRLCDPRRHLATVFPPVSTSPGLVCVQDVPITSVCEHHMLPFTGVATVAYLPLPGQKIVGLSKLARVVQEYAARTQCQERITHQVVGALDEVLSPQGAACAIRATHSCMALRGACTGTAAAMVTVEYTGCLSIEPYRSEFAARLTTAAWRG